MSLFRQKFFNSLLRSLIFVFALILLSFLVRVAFVIYVGYFHGALFEDSQNQNLIPQLLLMFYNGALYDNRIAGGFGILYFVIDLLWISFLQIYQIKTHQDPLKCKSHLPSPPDIFAYFVFALLLFVSIANFTYYTIYKDVFNIILLGIFFDDQRAILEDGLSGKYFLSIKFLAFFIALWLWIWGYKKVIQKIRFFPKTGFMIFLIFNVLACLLLVCINSSFSLTNISLDQELKPVNNSFLRKITPSPFRSLYLVYRGYKSEQSASFSSFTSDTPTDAVRQFFSIQKNPPYNLKDLLAQQSTKPKNSPQIKHIFWIVAESLGSYAFDSVYDEIGLMSGLKSLVDNQHGFLVENFFENAHGTIWSIESQISGLYYTGVRLSFRAAQFEPFLTAPANNLKRAGYKTRFYYGGSEIWQNLLEFSKSQGFDEAYGLSSYEVFAQKINAPEPYKNVWGIWDNLLFDFVAENAKQSVGPTFNMLLTTSFHGPNNLPWSYIEAIGGKQERFEKFLTKHPNLSWSAKELGILWWVDKHIARFIKEFSELYPDSLFVVTGDHTHYGFVSGFKQSRQVPFFIYSSKLKPRPLSDAGSQLDILPTIANLVTPQGFVYYSFGRPLFSLDLNEKYPNPTFVAHELVGNATMICTQNQGTIQLKSKPDLILSKEDCLKRMQNAKALSWYIFTRGTEIRE